MSSDARTQPAPRARAVASAPVDALLARADELARRWAIALILGLPLERIGEFPLEGFARQAPLLCAHVVRALQSDVELERMTPPTNGGGEPSPARRLAEVTGARDGRAAVEAVEALRGVLWEALLEELRWHGLEQSPAREVADLADRLAYVCSSALVSSLLAGAPVGEGIVAAQLAREPAAAGQLALEPDAAARTTHPRAVGEVAQADREPSVERPQRAPLGDGVVIVDEGGGPARRWSRARGERERAEAGEPAPSPAVLSRAGAGRTRARPRPWDTPPRDDPAGRAQEPA